MDRKQRTLRRGANSSVPEHQKKADDLAFFLARKAKLVSGEVESGRDSPRAHNAWIRDRISEVGIEISLARDALLREMRSAKAYTVRSGRYTFSLVEDRFHIMEERTGIKGGLKGGLKGGAGGPTAGYATVLGVPIPQRTLDALVREKRK